MSFGADWTCSCGWANLDVRPKCRNCGAVNPNYTPVVRKPASSPAGGDVARELRTASFAVLEQLTNEFGWMPDASASEPVSDDPDCGITWGRLHKLRDAIEAFDAALSPSTSAAEPVARGEPDGWQWRMWNGPAEQMSDWMEGRRQFSDAVAKSLRYEERPLYATPPAPAAVDGQTKAERDGYQSKLHWLRAYRAKTGAPLNRAMAAYDQDEPFGRACIATDKEGDRR